MGLIPACMLRGFRLSFLQCSLVEPQHSLPGVPCCLLAVQRERIVEECMCSIGVDAHLKVFFVGDHCFDQFIKMHIYAHIFCSVDAENGAGDVLNQFNRVGVLAVKYHAGRQLRVACEINRHSAAEAESNASDLPGLDKTLGVQIVYGPDQVLGQSVLWDAAEHHWAYFLQDFPLFLGKL